MNDLMEILKTCSSEYFLDTVRLRRQIHQYPELSEHEHITARYICSTLKSYGISSQLYLNETAVIAVLEGQENTGKTLALRADTDALPIEEQSDKTYASTNKGIMHACGHDAHIASLLTTARLLKNQHKDKWNGKIILIFQPSEETYPGGAIRLIQENILTNYKIDAALALHVSPEIDTGKIGIKAGKFMASTDEIYINVEGKAGHAAITQSFINPIIIASHILIELEKQFNASAPEEFPSVLTFGRIIGSGKTNIVPREVNMEGTLRTFDEEWRKKAHRLIKRIATKIAREYTGNANVNIVHGYPVLYNNETMARLCVAYAEDYIGNKNVISLPFRMTSDDFAYFSHEIPSLLYRLGVKIEGNELNLHAPDFDINEKALEFSPGLMAFMAINLVNDLQNE